MPASFFNVLSDDAATLDREEIIEYPSKENQLLREFLEEDIIEEQPEEDKDNSIKRD